MKCANVMAAIAFSPTLARGRPRTCSGMRLWLRMAGGVRSDLGKRIGVPPKMGRTGQKSIWVMEVPLNGVFPAPYVPSEGRCRSHPGVPYFRREAALYPPPRT